MQRQDFIELAKFLPTPTRIGFDLIMTVES